MIICEERQLPPNNSRQYDDHAVEATEMTEADPFGARPAIDNRGAVGSDAHQTLGTAQDTVKAAGGLFKPRTNPLIRPAHEIGGKDSQQRLDADARRTATHQVLDLEGGFLLLVAGLDRLAAVVVVKPLREIEFGR